MRSNDRAGCSGNQIGNIVRAIALHSLIGTLGYSTADAFTVNTTEGGIDTNLLDGICSDQNGKCSMNAAIQQGMASGDFTIQIAVPYVVGGFSVGNGWTVIGNGAEIRGGIELGSGCSLDKVSVKGSVDIVDGCALTHVRIAGSNEMLTVHGSFNRVEACDLSESELVVGGGGNVIGGSVANRNILRWVTTAGSGHTISFNYIGLLADGITPCANSFGLSATSGGQLLIERNIIANGSGLQLLGCTNSTVQQNIIGLDATGTIASNRVSGIELNAAKDNTIRNNIISGNRGNGIWLSGGQSDGNQIYGNRIGVDAVGETARPNGGNGIRIESGSHNVIGRASELEEGNVISGNSGGGVSIWGQPAEVSDNVIRGNLIGVSASGSSVVSNGGPGVLIYDAPRTIIGGAPAAVARNIISGNKGSGVSISGPNVVGCRVQANYIGLNASGSDVLGNGGSGIIASPSSETIIGCSPSESDNELGNVVAGSQRAGLALAGGSGGNVIFRNLIGTLATGFPAAGSGNGDVGISVVDCPDVRIGDESIGGNVICDSGGNGIYVSGAMSTNVTVEANLITGGQQYGIRVLGAPGVVLGGQRTGSLTISNSRILSGPLNAVGGHPYSAIRIENSPAACVQGNLVGFDPSSNQILPGDGTGIEIVGCADSLVGGAEAGMGNVVLAQAAGIDLGDSSDSMIAGNCVGALVGIVGIPDDMSSALGNHGDGVALSGSSNVPIGGSSSGYGNIIVNNGGGGVVSVGNSQCPVAGNSILRNGLQGISVTMCTECAIEGNWVGIGVDQATPAGNGGAGIEVLFSTDTTVGGLTAAQGNRVVFNGGTGLTLFGDSSLIQYNVFGGNVLTGIGLYGDNNAVYGNVIGLTADAASGAGNVQDGIMVLGNGNLIGSASGLGNTVAANGGDGVVLLGSANIVFGNKIGVSQSLQPFGNMGNGISLYGSQNQVGSPAAGADNTIAWNHGNGVFCNAPSNSVIANAIYQNGNNGVRIAGASTGNTIQGNSLDSNGSLGINWDPEPPYTNDYPDVDGIPNIPSDVHVAARVTGTLHAKPDTTYRLDFYGNDAGDPTGYGEGKRPLGFATVSTSGLGDAPFSFDAHGEALVTVTATEPDGSTSEFSACTNTSGVNLSPMMAVLGTNGAVIAAGDLVPSGTDGTDFGSAAVTGAAADRLFAITNSGNAALSINAVQLSGAQTADFTVVSFPAAVAAGGRSNLVLRFAPLAAGLRAATITLINNDPTNGAYGFAVQGTGTLSPVIAVLAGPNGTVAPSGVVDVAYGGSTSFVVKADAYYHIRNLLTNGVNVGAAANQRVFTSLWVNVTATGVLEVAFAENLTANTATPEWWLAHYGWTNDFDAWALTDSDHDGMNNGSEYFAGTNPTNAASRLSIINAVNQSGSRYVLTWPSVSGRCYSVERSTNLMNVSFSGVATNLPAVIPVNVYTDDFSGTPLFYRIRVGPSP